MKKRIMCIIVAILMVLPLVLTSCNKTRSEEEIINDIVNSGTTALTLSIWVPTEADHNDAAFKERLSSVQDAINEILLDKNYSTKIELHAISSDAYEAALNERFSAMDSAVSTQGSTAYQTAQNYQNKAEKVYYGESYIYELAYPSVLDTQLDIFLIRGYDSYLENIANGNVQKLNSYISIHGSLYSNINKLIRPNVLAQMKVKGDTYAIPNNHLYADTYQYLVINKEVFDSQSEFKLEDLTDIYACEEYMNAIGQAAASGIVPFVGSMHDAPGVVYVDKDNLIGGNLTSSSPVSIYDEEAYIKYVSLYKTLADKAYAKAELASGEVAAVSFFTGTYEEAKALEGENYLVKSTMPVAESDDIFASMFAVSSYSADYDRSMKLLYMLQYNEEIRTLLQYGIVEEDYEITDVDGKEVISVLDTAYDMNILYTGNGYYTYPGDGMSMDDWEEIKDVNSDMVIDPFILINHIVNNDKLTAAQKTQLEQLKTAIESALAQVKTEVAGMSADEFATFLEQKDVDIDVIFAKLEKKNGDKTANTEEIAELQALLDEETDAAEIEKLNKQISDLNEANSALDEEIAELNEQKSAFEACSAAVSLNSIKSEYSQLVRLYAGLN